MIAVAKIAVVAFILFAVIGIARVAISAVTVTTSIESQQLSGQISDARTEGNDLEVAQSMLSNPTRIKVEATALGMGAAADVEKIDLSGDVVVTDDVGNLSLSGSVAAAALLTQGGTRCPSALATIAARTRAAPVPSLTERRRRAESRPSLVSTTRAGSSSSSSCSRSWRSCSSSACSTCRSSSPDDYSSQAQASRTISFDISARRGTIYDRNGVVLATSVDATTVYCDPSEVTDVGYAAAKVAETLGGSPPTTPTRSTATRRRSRT